VKNSFKQKESYGWMVYVSSNPSYYIKNWLLQMKEGHKPTTPKYMKMLII
jgi:hypothetical protein